MNQKKPRLTRRMLPFLMKPVTLIVLTVVCLLGEVMWMYLGILVGSQLECLAMFVFGLLLGYVGGKWTAKLWDTHFLDSILGRVRIMGTPMGKRNTAFIILALGIPMILSFIPSAQSPFLPVIQSYIFGFICSMNVAIYRWARRLPKE